MVATAKPARTMRVANWDSQAECGMVRVTERGERTDYFVSRDGWDADGNPVWLVNRSDLPVCESYRSVPDAGECSCPAGRYEKKCQHNALVRVLERVGVA